MSISTRARASGLVVSVAILALAGCGGSSSSMAAPNQGVGSATLTIQWPTGRLIPQASQSITVQFLRGTTVVQTRTVAKPSNGTTTLTFTGLPAGPLTLKATAYPTTGGTGVAQATATQDVTIVQNQTTDLSINMDSTITKFNFNPTSVTMNVGGNTQVTGTAVNSTGQTVLTTASKLQWTSSNPSVATVSTSGLVHGVAGGVATITLQDTESGISSTFTVTVNGGTGGARVTVT